MLVLSRKKNEAIVISNNIKIIVVDIRGDKIRLGIEAPEEISVHRLEVAEAIQHEGDRRAARQKATAEQTAEQTQTKDRSV